MRAHLASLFLMLLTVPLVTLHSGCGGGTGVGNPTVATNVTFAGYTAFNRSWLDFLIPPAYASVTSLKFCFKRLRFKATSNAPTGDNIDLAIGEVAINSAGTSLATVSIPSGTYERVEFDLDPSCPSGKTIQLTNGNGSFVSTDSITIRFDGTFTASGASALLPLGVQAIITQLNSVTANSNVITYAQAAGGTF